MSFSNSLGRICFIGKAEIVAKFVYFLILRDAIRPNDIFRPRNKVK